MPKYDEALKAKALAIAEATTVREAAEQTGIPEGTIKRWRFENRRSNEPSEPNRTNRTPKNLQPAIEQAIERATAEAGEYIVERLKALADQLYGLAEFAACKVRIAIADPDEVPPCKQPEPHDRDGAAWVRALVGVMAQAIDKAQLLSGKPTARSEVTDRHEYDITQRIISDPEAVEVANQLLRRAAGRDAGALRVHGERGSVDTV